MPIEVKPDAWGDFRKQINTNRDGSIWVDVVAGGVSHRRSDAMRLRRPRHSPLRRILPPETSSMSLAIALDPLDLAALLCSRVCHDLISPTGAIVNGLEVLEEEDTDEETKTFAL